MNMTDPDDSRPLRVLSNTSWFEGRSIGGRPIRALRLEESGFWGTLRAFFAAGAFDVAVISVQSRSLVVLCLLKLLLPGVRWRLISVDTVLLRPRNWRERLRLVLVRRLFQQVDRFLLFFKDTSGLESVYGIDPQIIRYVPFKVNDYDAVTSHPTTDEGYVLSCGRSKRDYETLCRAAQRLSHQVRILAPAGDETAKHATTFDFRTLPANVRLVVDDGSHGSWIDWIARSTCVVLPVLPDTLAPSGISTYLVAMALGKCVIITDSPATRGLIDQGQAVVVPPSDAAALRAAIIRVLEDEAYRHEVASSGRQYALALKDENRLAADVTAELGRLLGIVDRDQPADTPEPLAVG